jgi:hypothetical protein
MAPACSGVPCASPLYEGLPPSRPAASSPVAIGSELAAETTFTVPLAKASTPGEILQAVAETMKRLEKEKVAAAVLRFPLPHEQLTSSLETSITNLGGSMTRIWWDEPSSFLVRLMLSPPHSRFAAGMVQAIDRAVVRDFPESFSLYVASTGAPRPCLPELQTWSRCLDA